MGSTLGHKHFSNELGDSFLDDCFGIQPGMKLLNSQVFKVRTIHVLADMLENNCFLKCHQKPGKQASPQFKDILENYGKLQLAKKISKRTLQGKKIILVRFLNFLNKQGITGIEALTSDEVLSYLDTLKEYSSNTRSGIMYTVRDFLLFLHLEKHIKTPLNNLFPVIFTNKYERLPSYYLSEEIHKILCQIDRNTVIGRRDYLILLLAVQFGMRAGDIRQLKFKNIKLSRNTVELVQQKTKRFLQLPVTKELKYALADYLKNSRPNVDDPHIFIKSRSVHPKN
ncbi:integrase/recombinase family protein [Desulforapulum autotrophicum HRM2]|uniref:Integrase/recombinase family protein n=1 Tax=Desulforapulum autotrophicum (strain ATCC 43914 / DSM 3382 / VKM B-1955 / HRM2) TaxID=177437 RepID=C0QEZ3_DESAH|nr:tyrosine-type recombinase/integrase [Desulforapulum autotrophicum]ACN17494.1 integrase/recombinase family protein [Desulforapulum autotrophicum HRM2]